jgi:Flp pilus assembly protein TadD
VRERSEAARRQAQQAVLGRRPAAARDILAEAVRFAPEDGNLWLLLADAHRMLGEQEAALAAATRAVAVGDSTSKSDAHFLLGVIAMAGHRPAEALEASRQAVRWNPGSEKAWMLQVQALQQGGDVSGAAAACRQAIAATGGSDKLQSVLAGLERGR